MTKIVCIGGFLGSGKTTAIIQAARQLKARGIKVGVVTNDQGYELVDTALVREEGFEAAEIGGGCFCCRFQDFVRHARELLQRSQAEIILAEAVGSCTDLAATVCERLRRDHASEFQVAPLTVMVDPGRGRKMCDDVSPFNTDIRYLFGKQLSEADHIVLNKKDLFREEELITLQRKIRELAGDIPVHTMSAKTGAGVAEWLKLIEQERGNAPEIELDYERYGAAEAALGWLNANFDLVSDRTFAAVEVGQAVIANIQQMCRRERWSIAHVKALVVWPEGSAWIALTDTEGAAAWDEQSGMGSCREASIILNARVCARPEELTEIVKDAVLEAAASRHVMAKQRHLEAFSPAPPKRPEWIARP